VGKPCISFSGALLFQHDYDNELITPTGDKADVVEKDGTRLLKNGRPQFSEDYPKFQCVCVFSRDFRAAVEDLNQLTPLELFRPTRVRHTALPTVTHHLGVR
jgi:hypothetical protein